MFMGEARYGSTISYRNLHAVHRRKKRWWQARHSKSQMVAAEFKALEHIRARLQLFAGHILPSGYLTVRHGKWSIYRCFTY